MRRGEDSPVSRVIVGVLLLASMAAGDDGFKLSSAGRFAWGSRQAWPTHYLCLTCDDGRERSASRFSSLSSFGHINSPAQFEIEEYFTVPDASTGSVYKLLRYTPKRAPDKSFCLRAVWRAHGPGILFNLAVPEEHRGFTYRVYWSVWASGKNMAQINVNGERHGISYGADGKLAEPLNIEPIAGPTMCVGFGRNLAKTKALYVFDSQQGDVFVRYGHGRGGFCAGYVNSKRSAYSAWTYYVPTGVSLEHRRPYIRNWRPEEWLPDAVHASCEFVRRQSAHSHTLITRMARSSTDNRDRFRNAAAGYFRAYAALESALATAEQALKQKDRDLEGAWVGLGEAHRALTKELRGGLLDRLMLDFLLPKSPG